MPAILPDAFLRCLDPSDRKKLAGGQLTAEEALSKAEVRSEKELQRQIVALLRLHNIEPIVSRMDRKTSNNVGTPDVLFSVVGEWKNIDADCEGQFQIACAWEAKMPNGKLSIEQEQMHLRMSVKPNAWHIKIIRSVQEAVDDLRELGVIPPNHEQAFSSCATP